MIGRNKSTASDRVVIVDVEKRLPYDYVDTTIATCRSRVMDATAEELVEIRTALLDLLRQVNETTSKIRTSVSLARQEHAAGHASAPRDWLLRAERAATAYGQKSQAIQQCIGTIKRREKELNKQKHSKALSDGVLDVERIRSLWRALGVALGELPEGGDAP